MKKKKAVGLREILAMKARGRELLREIIGTLNAHRPVKRHFKDHHGLREIAQKRKPNMLDRILADQVEKQMQTLADLAYTIFEDIAHSKHATEQQLLVLTNALNADQDVITYHASGRPPYRRVQSADVLFAHHLLDYMNHCETYGPEHSICEVCGSLMIAGRGGKRYCSPECRKSFWSYTRQKDYYTGKRKGGMKK
jgi:hypothetical protein